MHRLFITVLLPISIALSLGCHDDIPDGFWDPCASDVDCLDPMVCMSTWDAQPVDVSDDPDTAVCTMTCIADEDCPSSWSPRCSVQYPCNDGICEPIFCW
jgi:hypothetical protein